MYARINRSKVEAASACFPGCRPGAATSIASTIARVATTHGRRCRDGEPGKPI